MAERQARASVLKDAGADPVSLACRRRLADGPRLRWLWAVVSALVCSGVPPLMVGGGVALVWQGLRRRTPLPALFGLALFGGYAFVLLTLGAGFPPLLQGVGVAVFAAGHHQGQLRAVRDGRRWLALDHDSGAGWPR